MNWGSDVRVWCKATKCKKALPRSIGCPCRSIIYPRAMWSCSLPTIPPVPKKGTASNSPRTYREFAVCWVVVASTNAPSRMDSVIGGRKMKQKNQEYCSNWSNHWHSSQHKIPWLLLEMSDCRESWTLWKSSKTSTSTLELDQMPGDDSVLTGPCTFPIDSSTRKPLTFGAWCFPSVVDASWVMIHFDMHIHLPVNLVGLLWNTVRQR